VENYFLPGDLEGQIEAFVEHYKPAPPREPGQCDARVCLPRQGRTIIKQRERIKRLTIEHRRLQHRKLAA